MLARTRFLAFTRLLIENFAWIGVIALILTFITGFASGDLVRAYSTALIDVIFTYGFLLFWAFLDAFGIAIIMAIVQSLLEWALKRSLKVVFRGMLVLGFAATWLYLVKIVISQLT